MKLPLIAAVAFTLVAAVCGRADTNPEIVALGHDTYALTRWANNGFSRNTDKLKAQALEDAAAYCAKLHKELKVMSTETKKPLAPMLGFANAKVTFKALDASDPDLRTPASTASAPTEPQPSESTATRTATDTLYSDLMKLDDLRKRGILTEEEFQAQKKKLLEK